jgi:hypothetical protein
MEVKGGTMRRLKVAMIDDDPTLFDVPAEWLVPEFRANARRRRELDHEYGLRSLANDVDLLSRKEWPKASRVTHRLGRIRHYANPGPYHSDAAWSAPVT